MSAEAVRLRFPARAEYLLLARLAVAEAARRLGLGGRDVADLKLAVTEACSNVVRHAYAEGTPGEIELELVLDDACVELVVEDFGAGSELLLPESAAPSENGGMGIPLIRAVVDELEIRPRATGTGTVVHMTKHASLAEG